MPNEYEQFRHQCDRLADTLERLARTQANLPLPLNIEEAADLRAAARLLRGTALKVQ